MIIPDSIRIAGVDYKVEYEDRLNNGTTLAYGHISFDNTLIRIDANLKEHQGKCQTLIHELLHGICNHFDLDELNTNEIVIDKLAKGLYMIIQDNEEMFCKKETTDDI